MNATKLYGLPTVFGFGYYPKVRLRAQYGLRRHPQRPVVVGDEDPDEGRSRLVGVEHELALLRCAFEYRETLNLKAPWNNREPKGAFVLHILVYEKPSQREL